MPNRFSTSPPTLPCRSVPIRHSWEFFVKHNTLLAIVCRWKVTGELSYLTWMMSLVSGSVMAFKSLTSPPPGPLDPICLVTASLVISKYPAPNTSPIEIRESYYHHQINGRSSCTDVTLIINSAHIFKSLILWFPIVTHLIWFQWGKERWPRASWTYRGQ